MKTLAELVEQFQCPGCVGGPDPARCPAYDASDGRGCSNHVPGTSFGHPDNRVMLGMPTGFNKRLRPDALRAIGGDGAIEFCTEKPLWDHLNVPVWAMVKDGFLFVRTFRPRIGAHVVQVIEGGTLADVPSMTLPIDVSAFCEEID
jgi:hypothetical protein